MRIDGIVTAAGEKYLTLLEQSLPIWANTLDSIRVVLPENEYRWASQWAEFKNVGFLLTDVFTQHGAFFNKGAALAQGYQLLKPTDFVLHFDADILPPKNWRSIAEIRIACGRLYGCDRTYENGGIINDPEPFPYGYFHLWNVNDPASWRRPLWDVDWPSAGHYEISFIERWPRNQRIKLPFTVVHPMEPRSSWYGETEDGKDHMKQDQRIGHHEARIKGFAKLKVPEFKRRILVHVADHTLSNTPSTLDNLVSRDPFETYVEAKLG